MKDFRTTPYIQLLSKGAATKEEFQNALSDFTHQIYNFCSKEGNIRFIYFSLNYIRVQLIHIEEIKEATGGRLSANGGIIFVEAAIEWIKQGSSDKCVVFLMHCQNLEFKEFLIPVSVGLPFHCFNFIVNPFSFCCGYMVIIPS